MTSILNPNDSQFLLAAITGRFINEKTNSFNPAEVVRFGWNMIFCISSASVTHQQKPPAGFIPGQNLSSLTGSPVEQSAAMNVKLW